MAYHGVFNQNDETSAVEVERLTKDWVSSICAGQLEGSKEDHINGPSGKAASLFRGRQVYVVGIRSAWLEQIGALPKMSNDELQKYSKIWRPLWLQFLFYLVLLHFLQVIS